MNEKLNELDDKNELGVKVLGRQDEKKELGVKVLGRRNPLGRNCLEEGPIYRRK